MWLPERPSEPVIDNWPPKPLSIYADLEYERMTELPIDDSEGEPVPDSELPDGLVVEPATDNVAVPYPPDKPDEPAEGDA